MSDFLELAVMIFFVGVLSIWYGIRVHNSSISTVMGFLTILTVVALVTIAVIVALTL